MVIQTLREIVKGSDSIIEANKIRMANIKKNIEYIATVDELIDELEKAILTSNIEEIGNIISYKLFYEEIILGIENALVESYNRQANKKCFMDELKKSYILRGVKGVQFAWIPIIRKGCM